RLDWAALTAGGGWAASPRGDGPSTQLCLRRDTSRGARARPRRPRRHPAGRRSRNSPWMPPGPVGCARHEMSDERPMAAKTPRVTIERGRGSAMTLKGGRLEFLAPHFLRSQLLRPGFVRLSLRLGVAQQMPAWAKLQFTNSGVSSPDLDRVLGKITSLTSWVDEWESLGRQHEQG